MPFHEGGSPGDYMEQEGKKLAQETEARAKEQEAQETKEQEPELRPIQQDLLAEMQEMREKSGKGSALNNPEKLLRNENSEGDAFARAYLQGRETQLADVLRALPQGIAKEAMFGEKPSQEDQERDKRIAFLESLAVSTGPEEEELKRLQDERSTEKEPVGESHEATAEKRQGQEEKEIRLPAETLAEKLAGIKADLAERKNRPGSERFNVLDAQRQQRSKAVEAAEETMKAARVAGRFRDALSAGQEVDRLRTEESEVQKQIQALPPAELPGKEMLAANPDRQLNDAEYEELMKQITTRKTPKTKVAEQAAIEIYQRAKVEELAAQKKEEGRENRHKLFQMKYEKLGIMPKGPERDAFAVMAAKEVALDGDMRMAQDLLSRCSNRATREEGLREVAVSLAEQGIRDPELLKWVELGILDKDNRSTTMVDVMKAQQRAEIRKQLLEKGIEPEKAEQFLKLMNEVRRNPDFEKASKKWEGLKKDMKDIAVGFAMGAGGTAAAVGIFLAIKWIFMGMFASALVAGTRYAMKHQKEFRLFP